MSQGISSYAIDKLTHWGRDKKAAILQVSNWQQPSIGLDNGMAPDKRQPLSEPMLTSFTDPYMRHKWEMSHGK